MPRKYCIILFILLLSTGSHGQNYRFFYGKVTDRATGSALSNVNISLSATLTGTVSDRRGSFSFFTDSLPIQMVVSHLGYATQKIYLDGTSFNLAIEMERSATTLEAVEIRSVNAPEPFYRDDDYSVLDYAIDSLRVYVLIYRYSLLQSQIICRSVAGDTLAVSGGLSFRPVRLFRDCLGFVHVVGKDSVYQLRITGGQVDLIYPASLKRFMSAMNDCLASTDKFLFFKKSVNSGLSIEFYTVDRITSRKELMSVAHDQERSLMLSRNRDDLQLLKMEKPPDSRDNFVQWSFARKILYRPNTTSLHRLKDRIVVFNTVTMTIEFYNREGEFTGKLLLPVNEVHDGKWTQEIYPDEISGKVYTSFARLGQYTLYRIDLFTGELRRSVPFTHQFPQRIAVRDGFLFYMYDAPERADNKLLYRQKL